MTKKDYIKVANLIKQERINGTRCRTIIDALCNMFEKDNPRFDKKIFIDACGGK